MDITYGIMAPPQTYGEWEQAVKETKERLSKTSKHNYSSCGCYEYDPCTHTTTTTTNYEYTRLESKLSELIAMQKSYCSHNGCGMYLERSWSYCPHCGTRSYSSERTNPHAKCNVDYKKAFCGDCGKPVIDTRA